MVKYKSAEETPTIRAYLLQEMRSGAFALSARLPRESELALQLKISRTQLRDSLALLEREGFISRRHGVGTVINRHVLNVATRMDLEVEFLDMIRESGFTPAQAFVSAKTMDSPNDVAKRLGIDEKTPVLCVSRLITADGKPAIYCEDYVETARIKRKDYSENVFQKPIFFFLNAYCNIEPAMDLTEVRPITADAYMSDVLQVAPGTPLLLMDELDYDIEGQPSFCAKTYYVDGVIKHTVLRKKF